MQFGAGNGVRTRDPKLGKLVLYQLSYARLNALYNRQLIKVNSFLRHFCSEILRAHGHGGPLWSCITPKDEHFL